MSLKPRDVVELAVGAGFVVLVIGGIGGGPAPGIGNLWVAVGALVGALLASKRQVDTGIKKRARRVALGAWLGACALPVALGIIRSSNAETIGEILGYCLVIGGILAFVIGRMHFVILASRQREKAAIAVAALTRCPWCAEEIRAEARYCKHCHRDVVPSEPRPEDSTQQEPSSIPEPRPEDVAASTPVHLETVNAKPDTISSRARDRLSTGAAKLVGAAIGVLLIGPGVRHLLRSDRPSMPPQAIAALDGLPKERAEMLERAINRQVARMKDDPELKKRFGSLSDSAAFVQGQAMSGRAIKRLRGDDLATVARVAGEAFTKLPAHTCGAAVRGDTIPGTATALNSATMRVLASHDSAYVEAYLRAIFRGMRLELEGSPVTPVPEADFEAAFEAFFASLPREQSSHIAEVVTDPAASTDLEACYALSTLYTAGADLKEPYRSTFLRGLLQ